MGLTASTSLSAMVRRTGSRLSTSTWRPNPGRAKTPGMPSTQPGSCRFPRSLWPRWAALLGALPLALGRGVGSELRRPLGIAIVGGLIVSQLLTLYTTPVIYLAFDRLARRFRRDPA